MSIKNKVIILMLIPIVSILLLSLRVINDDYSKLDEYEKLQIELKLITKVSELVH